MKNTFPMLLVLLFIFSACNSPVTHDNIVGKWVADLELGKDEVMDLLGIPPSESFMIAANMRIDREFFADGTYQSQSVIKVYSPENEDLQLANLATEQSGKWELLEDRIELTVLSFRPFATDDSTQAYIESDPKIKSEFDTVDLPGEPETYTIVRESGKISLKSMDRRVELIYFKK